MKAGVIFTGTGPILVLTTFDSFTHNAFVEKLFFKGIDSYIVFELPVDLVRERYGRRFESVMGDVHQEDDLRVLDYNGHHILKTFSPEELGVPVKVEEELFHGEREEHGKRYGAQLRFGRP